MLLHGASIDIAFLEDSSLETASLSSSNSCRILLSSSRTFIILLRLGGTYSGLFHSFDDGNDGDGAFDDGGWSTIHSVSFQSFDNVSAFNSTDGNAEASCTDSSDSSNDNGGNCNESGASASANANVNSDGGLYESFDRSSSIRSFDDIDDSNNESGDVLVFIPLSGLLFRSPDDGVNANDNIDDDGADDDAFDDGADDDTDNDDNDNNSETGDGDGDGDGGLS